MTDCQTRDDTFSIDNDWINGINSIIGLLVSEIVRLRQIESYKPQSIFESRLNNKVKFFMKRFSECKVGAVLNNVISNSLSPLISNVKSQTCSFFKDADSVKEKYDENNNRSVEFPQKYLGGNEEIVHEFSFLNKNSNKTKTYLVHHKPTNKRTKEEDKSNLKKNIKLEGKTSMIPKIFQGRQAPQKAISSKIENSVQMNKADILPLKWDISPKGKVNHTVFFSPWKLDLDEDENETYDIQLNWTDTNIYYFYNTCY